MLYEKPKEDAGLSSQHFIRRNQETTQKLSCFFLRFQCPPDCLQYLHCRPMSVDKPTGRGVMTEDVIFQSKDVKNNHSLKSY